MTETSFSLFGIRFSNFFTTLPIDEPVFWKVSISVFCFAPRADHLADAVQRRLTIEHQHADAPDQHEDSYERQNCKNHDSSSHVDIDDSPNHKSANRDQARCRPTSA